MTEKPQKPIERARAELDAVNKAEAAIKAELQNLERFTGRRFDRIEVETSLASRQYLEVTIWLVDKQGE